MMPGEYGDEYPTCAATHVTLRVYGLSPDVVTAAIGLTPHSIQVAGEQIYGRAGSPRYRIDGWFLTTKGVLDSRDSRRHLDCLLDWLEPAAEALQDLRRRGARIDISCFWASATGHGGPTIAPNQARRLGLLELELGFDVYFWNDDTPAQTHGTI